MKITDIMVGDYVRITEPDKYAGHIGQVVNIGGENGYLTMFVPHHNTDVFIEDVEPIPLTKEILEKNGFKHRELDCADYYYIAEDYFDITIDEWSESIWKVTFSHSEMSIPDEVALICSVHELQHELNRHFSTHERADKFKVS